MNLKSNKYFAVFIIIIFITQNLFSSVLYVSSVAQLNKFYINGTHYADVFKYDNGNLLSDGTNKYSWDFENRLIQVTDSSDVVRANYQYDAQGRRIAKVFPDGKKVYYYWLNDWQVVEERDEIGHLLRENTLGISIDRPLTSMIYLTNLGIDTAPYGGVNQIDVTYHQNSLGNVLALTDNTENIVERYNFDLYGNLKVQDADGVVVERQPLSNFLFTGRELDIESGLYYFRNRYYSPKLAQFISTDPLDFVDGSNCYAYCNARYADMVDPLGMWGLSEHKDIAMVFGEEEFKKIFKNIEQYKNVRKGLLNGCVYPDIPEGYIGLDRVFDAITHEPEDDTSITSLTYRSHLTDLQYWHGMVFKEKDPVKFQEKIINRVLDNILEARKIMESDPERAGHLIGEALHTVEDTFSPSHVARDSKSLNITRFQSYTAQDPEEHAKGDVEKELREILENRIIKLNKNEKGNVDVKMGDSEKLYKYQPKRKTSKVNKQEEKKEN